VPPFEAIGRHRGVWFYTIGQRRGFEIISDFRFQNSDLKDRPPLYVIAKDVSRNRLVVGFGPETYRDSFEVSDCNWLAGGVWPVAGGRWHEPRATSHELRATNYEPTATRYALIFVRIRHLGPLIPCSISVNSEQLTDNSDSPFSIHRSLFTVHLGFAQRGVAPGQSAVFYNKNGVVLGGGVIVDLATPLTNSASHVMNLPSRIVEQNPQWGGGLFPVPNLKRNLFDSLYSSLKSPLITFLTGPRRVGKSVLLKQIINDLISQDKVQPSGILFFEFSPRQKQEFIWDVYLYFKQNILPAARPIYLFFDEVQVIPGFEITIKEIYDNLDQAKTKIFVTGSPSISYKRKMAESLAGRFIPYRLFPLNFKEYLRLKQSPLQSKLGDLGPDNLTRAANLEQLNLEFKRFLSRGRLPQMLAMPDNEAGFYLESSIDQTITKDAFDYFNIQNPGALSALFAYLCQNNGQITVKQNLSEAAGLSLVTVANYLDVLELMGSTYTVYNSTNPITRLNSARKIYVSSMFGLKSAKYDPQTAFGFAAESYVLERLLEQNQLVTFYRNRNKEIDFLLPKLNLAYEVKYRPQFRQPKVILPDFELKVLSYSGSLPVCLF
jgi:predicted AAA+ superfamily ATPase